jgi:hypothetical protein
MHLLSEYHVILLAVGAAKVSRICGRKSTGPAYADSTAEFASRVFFLPCFSVGCHLFASARFADAHDVRSAPEQAPFLLRSPEGFLLRMAVACRRVDPPRVPRGRAGRCRPMPPRVAIRHSA